MYVIRTASADLKLGEASTLNEAEILAEDCRIHWGCSIIVYRDDMIAVFAVQGNKVKRGQVIRSN